MKKLVIRILESWLLKLQPTVSLPTNKMNYDKAVNAIMSQTDRGRKTFFFRLVKALTKEDKEKLTEYLTTNVKYAK